MVINDTANTENVLYRSSGGRLHQFVILIIASLALIVGVMLPALSIEQQFWIVLLPIGVFGLSHGGADPMILKKLTATSPTGLFVVLCVYLMASLAFVALIWVLPVVALLVFLGLSVWHFGYTDEAFLSSAKNPLLRWLSGSMPILGPMLGHQPGKQASCLPGWLRLNHRWFWRSWCGLGLDRTATASGIRILFLCDSQCASFPFDCRTPLVVESKKPVPGVSGP